MLNHNFLRICWITLVVLVALSLTTDVANCETTTVTYQVSDGGDDSFTDTQLQFTGSDYLRIGYWDEEPPPFVMCAMRFRNIDVPYGVIITDARLIIRAFTNDPGRLVYGVIQAEDADNPLGFYGRLIVDLIKTTESVNWDHIDDWSLAKWYTSPDISEVLQTVIDRSGWSAGNAMVLVYSNRRSEGQFRHICSYDFGSQHTSGPKLEITYGELPIGDFEPDGDVDMDDFAVFARAWHTEEGDVFWNPACDLYADGFIDILDFVVFTDNWLATI